jgi:hypothetical protein
MPAPTLLASGPDAIGKTAYLLSNAQPLMTRDQFGAPVSIEPGTVWAGNRLFIGTGYEGVYFADGDRLYSQSTADFVRDKYLIAYAQGVARAAWMLPLAQAEIAIVMAFAGAAAGAIGLTAGVTVFLSKIASFYTANKTDINTVLDHLRPVLAAIVHFRKTCPRLFSLLSKALAENMIAAVGEGLTLVDAAVFLAALLGGLVKADAAANLAAGTLRLTLRGLAKVANVALLVTSVKRGPGAAVHGAAPQATQVLRELQAGGIPVSEQELYLSAAEQCVLNPINRKKLEELIKGSEAAAPLLDSLSQRLKAIGF